LWNALKPGGVFFLSFKLGEGERVDEGRRFTDADENQVRQWLAGLPGLNSIECWVASSLSPEDPQAWVNGLAWKNQTPRDKLITGGSDPFLPHLCRAISHASEIDLAVSFVKTTGLRLLLPDLHAALEENPESNRKPSRVRVLTSDYLDITDPDALRLLLLLKEKGAEVRIFESAGSSFHLKTYLFTRFDGGGQLKGTAFVGSSNISRTALTDGLEWNYRVDFPFDVGFLEFRSRFEEVFSHPQTKDLSDSWIEAYEARRVPPQKALAPGALELEPPPEPNFVQTQALEALSQARREGIQRGLVVLPTGVGKTWLAAFDVKEMGARRVLFVAHREEILTQAAETFLRIRPSARIGFYTGKTRDEGVEVLCASVQSLGRNVHLQKFSPDHFDYIIVDEFHHAAASTYRRLLAHFAPRFLLGLTATPDRTDQADILSLCDDNLVFTSSLFDSIESGLLVPFHYYGIYDESVDYSEIPWRNGRFDPEQLSNKLATLARAQHSLKEGQRHKQNRTLAFCVSIRHAEFMAEQYKKEGVSAAAVYAGSKLSRGEALDQLRQGQLEVLFSVDLFNEGVDLPEIDTVMMLRPTESKVLFLQQLGRGLRQAEGKDHLVVLDFIGNHQSFLHKPQALFEIGATYRDLAQFARKVEDRRLQLPEGCYVNYDLALIDFLKELDKGQSLQRDYEALKEGLSRRPTLNEFTRAGCNLTRMRNQYGSWFEFVATMEDLEPEESIVAEQNKEFLKAVEITPMTKCFKMVLLEAFQELEGWANPPALSKLAERSWQVLQRRPNMLPDLTEEVRGLSSGREPEWQRYWMKNPVNAWIGGNIRSKERLWFRISEDRFVPTFEVEPKDQSALVDLVQELVDYRMAAYAFRLAATSTEDRVIPFPTAPKEVSRISYFPNLRIACGHFKTGFADAEEFRLLGPSYGRLDPAKHFIARATGDSMDGGKNPIRDGDYLLLELLSPSSAGAITGSVMVVERQDETGEDDQYLLRVVDKDSSGRYVLRAKNPDYEDIHATDEMRTLARLKGIIPPIDLAVGKDFKREEIPALFGEEFNPGNWNSGHVTLPEQRAHVLLVTINKQGKAGEHRYLDHWIDENTFAWQSQNSTSPTTKRGVEIIEHEKRGIDIHLFTRESKLSAGKAAPFTYQGRVRYQKHSGSEPMNVVLEVVR
jgi:superfamily II DNA or RNA helicase/HKD family nuclease/SOS-response transcriptional repressor LexA